MKIIKINCKFLFTKKISENFEFYNNFNYKFIIIENEIFIKMFISFVYFNDDLNDMYEL